MTLQQGVRLGVYEIVALIGAGGMGEVRFLVKPYRSSTSPSSWTNDGHLLAFFARPVTGPDLSPDGRWLACEKTVGNGTRKS